MNQVLWLLFLTFTTTAFKPSSALAAPMCAQIFTDGAETFQFNDNEALGFQVLQRNLLFLDHFFITNRQLTEAELVDLMIKKDLRNSIFRIESLTYLYAHKDPKFFKPLLRDFKTLEDQIGQIALHESLRDKAQELNQPQLITYFQNQILHDRTELADSLKNFKVRDPEKTNFRRLVKQSKKYDKWGKPKKDRKFLLNEMISYTKHLRKDVQKMKFDESDIEKGLHEFRRRLRWILIYAKSLEGVIVYDVKTPVSQKVNSWFEEMAAANPKLLQSKAKFNTEKFKYSISVPLKQFLMLNQIVGDIGALKDNSETQIYFQEALAQTGSKMSISDLKISSIDHQKLSRDYQERINETDLLGEYLRYLEKLN